MHDVHAERPGSRDAHQRIHIGAIHVDQSALRVHDPADLADLGLEDAERVGVGQHQSRYFFGHGLLECARVDAAPVARLEGPHLIPRNRDAGGVGAVRGVRNQHVLPPAASVFKTGADHQESCKLALRARRRLEGHGAEAGNLSQAVRRLSQNLHAPLH